MCQIMIRLIFSDSLDSTLDNLWKLVITGTQKKRNIEKDDSPTTRSNTEHHNHKSWHYGSEQGGGSNDLSGLV